MDVCIGLEKV